MHAVLCNVCMVRRGVLLLRIRCKGGTASLLVADGQHTSNLKMRGEGDRE
jgi:hypothetical protein